MPEDNNSDDKVEKLLFDGFVDSSALSSDENEVAVSTRLASPIEAVVAATNPNNTNDSHQQEEDEYDDPMTKIIRAAPPPAVKQRLGATAVGVRGPGYAPSDDNSTVADDPIDGSKATSNPSGRSSTRDIIAAELVNSELDASERRRLREDVRREILRDVMPAHAVEVVTKSMEEADTQRTPGAVNWSRRIIMVVAALVLVAIVAVAAVVLGQRGSHQIRSFTSTEELYEAIDDYVFASALSQPRESAVAKKYGWPIGLWNVSQITNFSRCFDLNRGNYTLYEDEPHKFNNYFNEDISGWDVSNAETMSGMFAGTVRFQGNISKWNVAKVEDFSFMFHTSTFNGDISDWDTSNAYDMAAMFAHNEQFDGMLDWDVGNVEYLEFMFHGAKSFRGRGLEEWDVRNVITMESTFDLSALEADLGKWDVSSVEDMQHAFTETCCFDGKSLENWNLTKVEDLYGMFWGSEAIFDPDYSSWDVSRVTDIGGIFASSYFDGDVSRWDTSSVVNMAYAFADSGFEGDISNWNTKSVEDMYGMFEHNTFFDGNLSLWDTSSVQDMGRMFADAISFTGTGIEGWDTGDVGSMTEMFVGAVDFNADVSGWDVLDVEHFDGMFLEAESFRQSLCLWGPNMRADANVTDMFTDSGCQVAEEPEPPLGPLCTPCV